LESYAADFGLTTAQAREEWALTEAAGKLQAALMKNQSDVFGGMWIEHEPFGIGLSVLPGGESAVRSEMERFGLTTVTTLETAGQTLEALRRDQAALDLLIPSDIDFSSGIDQSRGVIEVTVENSSDAATVSGLGLPDSVVVTVGGLPTPAVAIYGGLSTTNGCTFGFSVEETSGTREGITTAAHCEPDTISYAGENLPLQGELYLGSTDAQWHTTPNLTDPNKIRVTSSGTTRNVTARKPLNQFVQGEHVCKYGRNTNYTCGYMIIIYVDPGDTCVPSSNGTFVLVRPNPGVDRWVAGGDSGGPVFHDNPATAYGTVTCVQGNQVDGIFMPQNFLSNIGVRVDID
jgi:hypothetical protein